MSFSVNSHFYIIQNNNGVCEIIHTKVHLAQHLRVLLWESSLIEDIFNKKILFLLKNFFVVLADNLCSTRADRDPFAMHENALRPNVQVEKEKLAQE